MKINKLYISYTLFHCSGELLKILKILQINYIYKIFGNYWNIGTNRINTVFVEDLMLEQVTNTTCYAGEKYTIKTDAFYI